MLIRDVIIGLKTLCYGHAAVIIGVGVYHGDQVGNNTLKQEHKILDAMFIRYAPMDLKFTGYRSSVVTIGVGFYHSYFV